MYVQCVWFRECKFKIQDVVHRVLAKVPTLGDTKVEDKFHSFYITLATILANNDS